MKWIKFSEKTPEHDQVIIFYCFWTHTVIPGIFKRRSYGNEVSTENAVYGDPEEHKCSWQPLPIPPKRSCNCLKPEAKS